MEISIINLSKKYGRYEVLKNINLNIKEGMYGLLGRNGAGKTTLLRILATLISKSEGEVFFNGISIANSREIRKIVGYLPQNFSTYPNMSVWKTMEYFELLSEIPANNREKRIEMQLKRVNLWEERTYKVKNLSGGMRQRLGIALALINDPQIIIADEPTAGLDPEERIRVRKLLVDLAKEKIVILSTHFIDDISATCDKIGVLHEGKLLFDGNAKDLVGIARGKVFVSQEDKGNLPIGAEIIHKVEGKIRFLSDILPTEKSESVLPTLEDAYIELIRRNTRK